MKIHFTDEQQSKYPTCQEKYGIEMRNGYPGGQLKVR